MPDVAIVRLLQQSKSIASSGLSSVQFKFRENRVGDSYGHLAYNSTRSMGTSGFNALFFCCPPCAMSQDSILSPKAPNQIICSPPGTIINSFCQLYVLALQTQNTKPDSNQILNRNETLTVFCE
ncbi:hypothetical protein RUM43_003337 [Polyplax serrata]|uniref:Uncharacterized protein n=1 Tax=Polyplax serrata TaxID=468196 RepID=A0AAN8NWI9_POLSC